MNFDYIASIYFRDFRGRRCRVNSNECYVWAWLVKLHHPRVTLCRDSDGCHAFVELDGRYYDSDSPRGVDAWRELKTISDCKVAKHRLVRCKDLRAWSAYWQGAER